MGALSFLRLAAVGRTPVASGVRRQVCASTQRAAAATRVVVCSKNPVKINAVRLAFAAAFPERSINFTHVSADSGVPDQPFGDTETLAGAKNRVANAARRQGMERVVLVALEGGVRRDDAGELECFAWAVVRSPVTGAEGRARSASFMLPHAIAELVDKGVELGDADDQVFGRVASGQGSGTVGQLTRGLITRETYYEHTVLLALAPFLNPEHYPKHLLD